MASNDFDCVNDIAPAFGAIAFGDVGSGNAPGPYRDKFLASMPPQGLVFGWPSYNEVVSVPDVSSHDKLYVVCELSHNLALLSTYRRHEPMKQVISNHKNDFLQTHTHTHTHTNSIFNP